jgi:hypothetical protein
VVTVRSSTASTFRHSGSVPGQPRSTERSRGDDGLVWIDGPDGMNVMFPEPLSFTAVRRGVDRARALGRTTVGAWLGLDVDPRRPSPTR